jgi:serine phosphatase RsbU (regulator of sigma subunit)
LLLATTISSGAERSTYPCLLPRLPGLEVAARFREPRIGGDFFDIAVSPNYLFLLMTDIAGERDGVQRIAAEVQEAFQQQAALLRNEDSFNESIASVAMLRAINGAIITASKGVRCSPTFLAIYNLALHTVTYISAGAPAALLMNDGQVRILESTGIPLGLFTHLTHEPTYLALQSGSRLVLLSKGVLESRRDHNEFGIHRVCQLVCEHGRESADQLCSAVLDAAEEFAALARKQHRLARLGRATLALRDDEQDLTVLAIARD